MKIKTSSKQFSFTQPTRRNRIDEAREFLAHIILAHVPVRIIFIEKTAYFLFI